MGRLSVAPGVIDYVPVRTAEKFNLVPIGIEDAPGGKKTIIVAMGDPTNLAALDELRFTTGCAVRPVVSGDGSIERAIRSYYYSGAPAPPQAGTSRSRTQAGQQPQSGSQTPEPEMTIMRGGEPQIVRMSADGGAPIPQAPPMEVGSLPTGALTPVSEPSVSGTDENLRRLNALLRVLVRRKLMTEEEFLAELAKG